MGPGSYNPNQDTIHRKMPSLTFSFGSNIGAFGGKGGPKKVLENYISNIFTTSLNPLHDYLNESSQELNMTSMASLRSKNLKLGRALALPRTE